MQGARWGMAQPEVRTVELYAASGAYGLDMPERLFWEAYVVRQDISHEAGGYGHTGRESEVSCRGARPRQQRPFPAERQPRL